MTSNTMTSKIKGAQGALYFYLLTYEVQTSTYARKSSTNFFTPSNQLVFLGDWEPSDSAID